MFKDDKNIIYFNSSCIITHNLKTNNQNIFGGHKFNAYDLDKKYHDDDVICFDYFTNEYTKKKDEPLKKWVASGQRGLMPMILVWEADTKKIINRYYMQKGSK